VVVGEASAEKLIAGDFVKPVYDAAGNGTIGCGFFGPDGEHLFSIPTETMPEAVRVATQFQDLFAAAIRRAAVGVGSQQKVVDDFHRLFYGLGEMRGDRLEAAADCLYMGQQIAKNPLDLWIYQEILYEMRPELVIELGTGTGASAHYLADIMDQLKVGRVLSVDRQANYPFWPQHARINYLVGDVLDGHVVDELDGIRRKYESVMVILDDDHTAAHVMEELKIYAQMVSIGHYLIVEDTNVNGHPVLTGYGRGPWEALHTWKTTDFGHNFMVDKTREKFLISQNPGGYLRRVR
jgi:cephalosporin hydroxylase